MASVDDLLEAERRGLLPPERLSDLHEARSRGLIPPALGGTAQTQSALKSAEPSVASAPPDEDAYTIGMGGSPITPKQLTGLGEGIARGAFVQAPQGIGQAGAHVAAWLAQHLAGPETAHAAEEHASNIDAYIAQNRVEYEARQRARGIPEGGDIGLELGTAASPVTIATAQAMAPAQGANLLARLSAAAGTGAAIAGEQPVTGGDFAEEKSGQAGLGALLGVGTEAGASVVAPWIRDQARHLAERYNIRVPIGTAINRFLGRAEQISQSIPASGMAVRSAYDTANADLVRAAHNEAIAPIEPFGFGVRAGRDVEPGRQLATDRGDAIAASYQNVIPRMRGEVDPQFTADIAAIRNRLPARSRADFDDAIDRHITQNSEPVPNANARLDGQNLKNADIDLREEARDLMQSQAPAASDKQLGRGLADVRTALRDMWDRYSNPRDIAQLNATDDAYGLHKIMERAETSSAAPEGVFGPTQLWQAAKAGDPTLGKRAISRGEARLQDLAETAKTVLGKTVADSGTPERGALMGLGHVLTGGAAVANLPITLATLGAHGAAYTGTGQAALRALAGAGAPMREGLAGMLRTASPGMISANAASEPYDQKPRSVAEWKAEHARRQQAGQAAGAR